ncbi:hypothetical protein [Cryobacterium zhongshanensis]|uniref:Uncharacterized protein n=1 Tax=Cryobacterium zhongshanensis TaxID=2928153 RepID=A0AA41R014_9MICO|nr:hypothetical protein [Cryobacterium zhongshanensis]MCI4659563.1 hypothetical protein [Cryobacterium zhongshanensis]
MADQDEPGTTFKDDMDELARRMTAIARRTYESRDGHSERYDFGEILTRLVTTTAANLGSVDALLAGRPGSWEADFVRQIVASSVPEDQLHLYRTEPVRLILDPESVFEDLGLRALFDDADNQLSDGYDDGTGPEDDGANDDAIDQKRETLEAKYRADVDAYFTAYAEMLTVIASERAFTVPVELERVTNYRHEPDWDTLAQSLHDETRARTPAPGDINA